jgi:hypothetical protein
MSKVGELTANRSDEEPWRIERLKEVDLLYLFHGKCGHQWVGALSGSFQCPVCGLWDGDHHLRAR